MNELAIDAGLLAAAVEKLQPGSLEETRRRALAEFSRQGLPDRRDENWKYTSLSRIADLSNAWLSSPTETVEQEAPGAAAMEGAEALMDAYWITLSNGSFTLDPALSELESRGLTITALSQVGAERLTYSDVALSSLNAALLQDGLHIELSRGSAIDKPIAIRLDGGGVEDVVTQERIIVDLREGASLALVECHLADHGRETLTNSVLQVSLAESAALDHVRIQGSNDSRLLTGRTEVNLRDGARYRYATFDFGARLVRNDVIADIDGADARVHIDGLYLADGNQHIDNHTVVNHRVGPASSREEFRGVLNGNARCVFNGKAVVYEGADGTDAHQSNHNLLLSDKSEIDTKPELEIYADDVKCSHGATVGQLDDRALFYIRSRGIGRDEAARILTRAFAANSISALPIAACGPFVESLLDAKLRSMEIR